jgi:hypothetical protein
LAVGRGHDRFGSQLVRSTPINQQHRRDARACFVVGLFPESTSWMKRP